MHNSIEGQRIESLGERDSVREIRLIEVKPGAVTPAQLLYPRPLQRDAVIVIETVEADNALATFHQATRDVKPDEDGDACNQNAQRSPYRQRHCSHWRGRASAQRNRGNTNQPFIFA